MYEIGRLCMKIAGRDARQYAVVVDNIDDNYVLVDGQVRRRKCNVKHLEPLDKVLKIKKKAPHSDVVAALKKEDIEVKETKKKEKKEKPKKKRKSKKKSETKSSKKKSGNRKKSKKSKK